VRFLLDENVPMDLLSALVARGHDAVHGALIDPQISDPQVLDRACKEERVLITFDSDFSRLIFHEGKTAPPGVVYMQSRPKTAMLVVDRFIDLLDGGPIALTGNFLIIDEGAPIRVLSLA
jgi:predicted nuclease of predicted toxin-antitoxin system